MSSRVGREENEPDASDMRTHILPILIAATLSIPLSACSGGGTMSPVTPVTTTAIAPLAPSSVSADLAASPTGAPALVAAAPPAALTADGLRRAFVGPSFFSDDFANGLNNWIVAAGAMRVCSTPVFTHAMCAPAGSNAAYAGVTSWTDYRLQAPLVINRIPGNRSGIDLVVRAQDPNHFYEVELVRESDGSGQWEMWKNDGGQWTNLTRGYTTVATNTTYVLRFDAQGSALTASLSGDGGANFGVLGHASDARYASGKIGVRAWGGLTGAFGTVQAWQLLTSTPQPIATASPTPVPIATPAATPSAGAYQAPAGTQPFPSGPFDTPVTVPQLDSNSSTYLGNIMGGDYAHIGKLQFSTGTGDFNPPVYIAHNSDPVYTIHCMYYGGCPLEGVQEHIPRGAEPAGNLGYTTFTDDGSHDQHLAVRNVDTGVEIDTWLTPQPGGAGGTLNVGYGGKYDLSSGGFNQPGGATAAGFALSLGRVRPVDLLAGRIPYAIFLVTPCENGHVYPASGNDNGAVAGCPPLGSHLWLDSTPAEVAASGAAPDFRVILNALHEFGGYLGDRCGSCNLGLGLEGGISYTAFHQPNPWAPIAAHFPGEYPSGPSSQYHILISSGTIDLSKHLHFITN